MKFTIFRSEAVNIPYNKEYPIEVTADSPGVLKSAVKYDHVCACYKDGIRREDLFLWSDVCVMDCDNDRSDNPEDWITPEKLSKMLGDTAFVLVYSRNHMKEKNGKAARPKFHVYFPIRRICGVFEYKSLKKRIYERLPFFDGNALDGARFFFGAQGNGVWHEGSLTIEDWLTLKKSKGSIPEGQRNSTMSRIAGKLVKRYGVTDTAYQKFLEKASECEPPLPEKELETMLFALHSVSMSCFRF